MQTTRGRLTKASGLVKPRKTSKRQDRNLEDRCLENRKCGAKQMGGTGVNVCDQTVRKCLKEMGFTYRKAKQTPSWTPLQKKNPKKRWAVEKQSFTVDDWMKVIVRNERRICIGQSDDAGGRSNEIHEDDCLTKTWNFPQSLMTLELHVRRRHEGDDCHDMFKKCLFTFWTLQFKGRLRMKYFFSKIIIMHLLMEQKLWKESLKKDTQGQRHSLQIIRISIQLKICGGSWKNGPWRGSNLQSWSVKSNERKLGPDWWRRPSSLSKSMPESASCYKSQRQWKSARVLLLLLFFQDFNFVFPFAWSQQITFTHQQQILKHFLVFLKAQNVPFEMTLVLCHVCDLLFFPSNLSNWMTFLEAWWFQNFCRGL